MKTIDINAKEWFDKANGNSYFSAVITLDFGTPEVKTINMPFQYGYGDSYIDEAKKVLTEHNYISSNYGQALWRYCDENDIMLTTHKCENCLKRDLKLN